MTVTNATLRDDVLDASHAAVCDLAVTLIRTCDHTRHHGHPGCPTCRRLALAVEWLAAYRELQRDAGHLLRAADALTGGAS